MIGLELAPSQPQVDLPLAEFFSGGGGQFVAIATGPNDGLTIWTEIAPHVAACLRLDNGNTGTRLSWRETLVMELRNIYPVGDLMLTGSWSQLQSSGSGFSSSYTGNRAISTSSGAAQADVTVDRSAPYDIWVHYTGRTSGSYCRVEIDGEQTLVNEIDDPAGLDFKAFSTYSATDLSRRQSIKVASGLTGSHSVTLKHGGVASPGGDKLILEAVAISASLSDPRILPPVWQPAQSYTMGDEVQYNGTFYAARATGTSGNTAPDHTGGIASDGALDWRADNRSTYPRFVSIDYGSEREYALQCEVAGVTTEIGGQTYGNEALQTRTILLDGAPWIPMTTGNGLNLGSHIAITETTVWQTGAVTLLADCTLQRQITPGSIAHDVTVMGAGPMASVEWLYIGMAPMVRWDGEMRTSVVNSVSNGVSGPVDLAIYDGQSPAYLEFPDTSRIGISATIEDMNLRYGLMAGALPDVGNRIHQTEALLLPNLDATSEGGSLDWKAKAYIKGDASGGLTFSLGESFSFYSRHVFGIT